MKQSAGILIYRRAGKQIEVLLAHPGGPFWSKKDTWSIPKGELSNGEDHQAAARREFEEEMGFAPPTSGWLELGESKQGTNKINHIWAVEGDPDIGAFHCSSMFEIEWPPKSGQKQSFPENDKISWFPIHIGRRKVFHAQQIFFDRLADKLEIEPSVDSQQSLF